MTARRRGRSPHAGERPPEASAETFADLLAEEEVERIAREEARVPEAVPRGRPGQAAPAQFHHPQPEEQLLGHARGIQASQLRKLRAGGIRPDVRIDLHGLRAEAARKLLLAELTRASESNARCVIVVHGRGLHSKGEPILRKSLPGWLASPRLEGCVLAFAPATPDDGGTGATYVLLRRKRG